MLLHPSAQSISRLKWLLLLPEFIGELEHQFSQSFIVKYSVKVDNSSPLQDTEGKIKLEKNIKGEHHLKLINKWWVELSFLCPGSAKLSCDVVFWMKEVTWILKYTNILGDRKCLVLGVPRREIPRVKLVSSSTIYGNTWFLKHGRKPNVSWSFLRSLQIYSGSFSQLQDRIW